MRKHKNIKFLRFSILLLMLLLIALLLWLLWKFVPRASVRFCLLAVCAGILAAAGLLNWYQRLQISSFAGEICETLDALMSGRQPEDYHPYEDSLTSRVQGKLLQYYDIMNEGKLQSQKDKETIQGLVSDISHQVKTPVANLRLYAGILKNPALPAEKRNEFLGTMSGQIDKLDFLFDTCTYKKAFATVSIPVDAFVPGEGTAIDSSRITSVTLKLDGGGEAAVDNIGLEAVRSSHHAS